MSQNGSMTSRERVLAAFDFEEPDHVRDERISFPFRCARLCIQLDIP